MQDPGKGILGLARSTKAVEVNPKDLTEEEFRKMLEDIYFSKLSSGSPTAFTGRKGAIYFAIDVEESYRKRKLTYTEVKRIIKEYPDEGAYEISGLGIKYLG